MQRYFVEASNIKLDQVKIIGPDVHHIRNVMRLGVGDVISVCPNDGSFSHVKITSIEKTFVIAQIKETLSAPKRSYEITIAQALIKKDRFELFLEKATELGVDKIIPTRFERSIVKVDSDKAVGKTERYRMIVKEASEQSERTILPIITDVENLVDIKFKEYDHVLFASERNQEARPLGGFLSNNTHQGKVLVLIGPEGGITNREIAILSEKGALPISLGPRILRSETAGIMVLSAFLSQWGE